MGISGVVKLFKDWITGTPVDTDYFLFGNTDIKKITFKALKTALGIDKLNTDVSSLNSALTTYETIYSGNYAGVNGCNMRYNKYTKILTINVIIVSTIENGAQLGTLPDDIQKPNNNRNIPGSCIFMDGTAGYFYATIHTDGKITIDNNTGKQMPYIVINGSAYIGNI